MSRALITRLRKLETKAKLDGSIRNMTDDQLDAAIRRVVEGLGGLDAGLEVLAEGPKPAFVSELRSIYAEVA